MAKQARSSAASGADNESAGKSRKRKVTQAPSPTNVARELSHAQIAEHAYGLFLARGAHDGGEVNDWLRAEQELRAQLD